MIVLSVCVIFSLNSLNEFVEENVGLCGLENCFKVTCLYTCVVKLLPLVVRIHCIANVVTPGRMLAEMLHHRVEPVLWGTTILSVLVEDANAEGRCHYLVRDSQHFIKGDHFPHLDWTVRENKAFELYAEHIRQFAD